MIQIEEGSILDEEENDEEGDKEHECFVVGSKMGRELYQYILIQPANNHTVCKQIHYKQSCITQHSQSPKCMQMLLNINPWPNVNLLHVVPYTFHSLHLT